MLYGFKAAQEKLGRLACSGWVAKQHFQNWVLRRCSLGTRFIWEVNLNPMQITPAEASHSSQYGSAWLWLQISITCKIDGCLFLNCNYIQNLEGRCLDFNNVLPLRGEPVNQFSSNISHMLDIENQVMWGCSRAWRNHSLCRKALNMKIKVVSQFQNQLETIAERMCSVLMLHTHCCLQNLPYLIKCTHDFLWKKCIFEVTCSDFFTEVPVEKGVQTISLTFLSLQLYYIGEDSILIWKCSFSSK